MSELRERMGTMTSKPGGYIAPMREEFMREELCLMLDKRCGKCAACIYGAGLTLPRESWVRRTFDRIALSFPIQF